MIALACLCYASAGAVPQNRALENTLEKMTTKEDLIAAIAQAKTSDDLINVMGRGVRCCRTGDCGCQDTT